MSSYPIPSLSGTQSIESFEGTRIGKIVNVDEQGIVYIDFKGSPKGPIAAKLSGTMQDRIESRGWSAFSQVLMVFEEADPNRPVIVDVVVAAVNSVASEEEIALQVDEDREATIDGETVTFSAQERIVFRCGKASITLTKAGKVILRGTYMLNRSSGVNRIKGSSVHLN